MKRDLFIANILYTINIICCMYSIIHNIINYNEPNSLIIIISMNILLIFIIFILIMTWRDYKKYESKSI